MSAQSIATDHAAVVRRGQEAFGRGDMATLRDLMLPDVKLHATGRHRTAGNYDGIDAVLGNFANLARETGGTFRTEVHDLLASDDHVVVLGRLSADREGRHIEGNYCQVFHFSGGRVSEMWFVDEDPYAADEFFS